MNRVCLEVKQFEGIKNLLTNDLAEKLNNMLQANILILGNLS